MIFRHADVLFTRAQHAVRLRPFRMVRAVRQELALQRQTLPVAVGVRAPSCRRDSYLSKTAGQGRWYKPSSAASHPQTRPVRQAAHIAFGLQQESVVVAFHLALIVIAQEILGDGFRLRKSKLVPLTSFRP
jgi:hypothetical protein